MYLFNRFFNIFVNRLCGILIIIILFLAAFFLGLNAASATSIRWETDDLLPTYAFTVHNCSSPTTCDTNLPTVDLVSASTDRLSHYKLQSDNSIGPSGLELIYYLNQTLKSGYLYSISTLTCEAVTDVSASANIGTSGNISLNNNNYYNATNTIQIQSDVVYLKNGSKVSSLGGSFNYCSIHQTIISPKTNGSWFSLRLYRDTVATSNLAMLGYKIEELGVYSAALSDDITDVISSSNAQTLEEINNLNNEIQEMTSEQQQTNEKLDDLNNSITSDDTSGGESQGSSFFNDFTISDNGGISGIITSPLRLINNLVSGNNNCNNLSFDLSLFGKDKTIVIDSGCRLWSKAKQPAVLTYHILLCGLTGYGLMVHLFKVIEKLKNPDESEVETLDL